MTTKDQKEHIGRNGTSKGSISQARILSNSAKVIAELGYDRASIRKIAAKMNMSISALYYYFSSKEELLYSIQHHSFYNLVKRLEEKLKGVKGPERRLYLLIENHLEYFVNRMSELIICSHEINTLQGDSYAKVEKIRRRYYNIAYAIVNEIRKKRKGNALTGSLATLNLFGMLNWVYMWFDTKRNKSYQALSGEIYNLFLNGIRSNSKTGPNWNL